MKWMLAFWRILMAAREGVDLGKRGILLANNGHGPEEQLQKVSDFASMYGIEGFSWTPDSNSLAPGDFCADFAGPGFDVYATTAGCFDVNVQNVGLASIGRCEWWGDFRSEREFIEAVKPHHPRLAAALPEVFQLAREGRLSLQG